MSLFKQLFRNMAMGSHGSNGGGHHGKKYGTSYSGSGYIEPAAALQICSKCNTAQAQQAQFCNQCGTSLAAPGCNKCGTILAAGAKFCSQCGQPR
jgi:ribosomal protein L40E